MLKPGKIISNIKHRYEAFVRRRRIALINVENGEERWHFHTSLAGVMAAVLALVVLLFLLLALLVAYTPVLEIFPGYRTEASKSREMLVRNIIRIDSLEMKMNDLLEYNENMILVVEGKTPAGRTQHRDSIQLDKTRVPASEMDSVLRHQMENPGPYALPHPADHSLQKSSINAVAPTDGIIAEKFNAMVGLYGVRIAGAPKSQVVVIADGTVMSCDWIPDTGNCITVQHANGMLSVYRQMGDVIVAKGQRVKSSEVIGYTKASDADASSRLFEFELWENGAAVDPEAYIVF